MILHRRRRSEESFGETLRTDRRFDLFFQIAASFAVDYAGDHAGDDQSHTGQSVNGLRLAVKDPADRNGVNETGIDDDRDAGGSFAAEGVGQEYLTGLRENADEQQIEPFDRGRRPPIIDHKRQTDDQTDQLKIEYDHERMFGIFHFPDEVVSDARTERGDDADDEKKKRNARIEILDQQNAAESESIKKPLQRTNAFFEKKYGDEGRKDRRQILDRGGGSERYVLQSDKEQNECGRAGDAAPDEQRPAVALPGDLRLPDSDITERAGDEASEKDYFHYRHRRKLFDKNIGHGKRKCRKKHLADAVFEKIHQLCKSLELNSFNWGR
jgi:hypothetical protein